MAQRVVRLAATAAMLTAVIGMGVGPALAAPPVIEREDVNSTSANVFLTEACGFPVTVTAVGSITSHMFENDGAVLRLVNTVNIVLTFVGEEGTTVVLRDVGAGLLRVTPDDMEIRLATGRVPFQFTGALIVNLTTQEELLVPQHVGTVEEACAALSA
jgi:hypothetical protein